MESFNRPYVVSLMEACRLAKASPETLRELMGARLLQATEVGSEVRISLSSLEAYVGRRFSPLVLEQILHVGRMELVK